MIIAISPTQANSILVSDVNSIPVKEYSLFLEISLKSCVLQSQILSKRMVKQSEQRQDFQNPFPFSNGTYRPVHPSEAGKAMDILEENAKTMIEGNSRGDLRSIEGECAGERRVCDRQSITLSTSILR